MVTRRSAGTRRAENFCVTGVLRSAAQRGELSTHRPQRDPGAMPSPDRISYETSMGKSTRMPVLAAGGIVIRDGSRPRVAIVQRRRDGAWVLPKGKLKPNERPITAAKREATEETGYDVRVHEFLGVISYFGSGGPKIVHFWRMRAIRGPIYKLTVEIKSVEWLPLSTAIDRLTLSHERFFLRNVGRYAMRRARERSEERRV